MNILKRIGRITGYLAFFLLVFLLAAVAKFPTEAAARWAFNEIQTNYKVKISAEGVERSGLTGIKLTGVRLAWDKTRDFDFAALDSLKIRLNPIPLLWGKAKLKLDISAYGGRVAGDFAVSNGITDLDLSIQGLDLAKLDLQRFVPGDTAEFATAGLVSGSTKVHLISADKPGQKDGSTAVIDLDINGLSISGIKVEIPLAGPFEIDPIRFEPAKLVLKLEHPHLKIEQGTFKGDQVEVVLAGNMTVKKDFMRSNYGYSAKFKLGEEFDRKYGIPLSMAAGQFNMRKDDQGYYRLDLRGTPSSPRIPQLNRR